MDLADGAATEMLVMMDDEAVECKTGMELFLFEGGHLNGGSWLAGWI
jgi:hypothetical protein